MPVDLGYNNAFVADVYGRRYPPDDDGSLRVAVGKYRDNRPSLYAREPRSSS